MSASVKRFPLKDTNLFKPIKIGECHLQHRVVFPPLTRYRCVDYTPTAFVADYYEQRSRKPGTFMITEGTYISPQNGGCLGVPGMYNDKQQLLWSKVFDRIHNNGSYIFTQLWGLGRNADPLLLKRSGYSYVSPSDIYIDGTFMKMASAANNFLRPMTEEEIQQTVRDYVSSSIRAIKLGADGVEIHSLNSYLLDQFLQEISNNRTDQYGGSIENRASLLLTVIDKVVAAVGHERVGVRFSPWGKFGGMGFKDDPIPTYSYVLDQLEKRAAKGKRLAYVHFIEPRVSNFKLVSSETEGSNEFIYKHWKGNVIRAGNYTNDYEAAMNDVNGNDRTLLAYGRFFTSNPDLPDRLEQGLPLTPYFRPGFYRSGPGAKGYTDFPRYDEMAAESAYGFEEFRTREIKL